MFHKNESVLFPALIPSELNDDVNWFWSNCPLNTRYYDMYMGADKSLTRPTSRCILFDGRNISFDASLVVYINSNNNPPVMIINRIYETQNLLSL